ncbi:MAG: cytochrome b/b6 domain-containing protein, partial [Curvibacter sp.]
VWDLPTRLFHWSLVLCVTGLVTTAQLGWMEWHFRLGYAMLSLLVFRGVWGLVGGRWSRFSAFVYTPATLWHYLRGRGQPEHSVGHSPTGAISVFGLLAFLLVQAGTGLISDDEVSAAGPLTHRVSGAVVSLASAYHRDVGKWILIALVVLHILAILYYLLHKRENLIRPMVHGDKELAQPVAPSADDVRSRLLAMVVLTLSAGGVWLLLLAA